MVRVEDQKAPRTKRSLLATRMVRPLVPITRTRRTNHSLYPRQPSKSRPRLTPSGLAPFTVPKAVVTSVPEVIPCRKAVVTSVPGGDPLLRAQSTSKDGEYLLTSVPEVIPCCSHVVPASTEGTYFAAASASLANAVRSNLGPRMGTGSGHGKIASGN